MIGNFNIRFVLRVLGFSLILEAFFMVLCSLVSFYFVEESALVMLICAAVALVFGFFLRMVGKENIRQKTTKRESFVVVTLFWIVLTVFGMLPFYYSGMIPNWSDAFFETMSGFTTTGSSVLSDIDNLPKGLLLWRSLTQWFGGISIIIFASLLFPRVGGSYSGLRNTELSGISKDKYSPKLKHIALRLWGIYSIITTLLIVLLWIGPMGLFDSVCHALTTVSTGGFSTKQANIAYWHSSYLEYVLCFFMLVGGTNFTLIYFLFKGRLKRVFYDEEFKWYIGLALIFTLLVTLGLYYSQQISDLETAFRSAAFQVISIATSTGFSTADYTFWGVPYSLIMILLMIFCASSGSASGGVKTVRMVILSKNAINEFKRQVHPNAVLPVRLNRDVIPTETVTKILAFLFLYLIVLLVSSLVLGYSGMGSEESVSASISCLSNVGPALGSLSPSGNYANIPEFSKWYLAFLMLVGRLEIFTVLSLFIPGFWKR